MVDQDLLRRFDQDVVNGLAHALGQPFSLIASDPETGPLGWDRPFTINALARAWHAKDRRTTGGRDSTTVDVQPKPLTDWRLVMGEGQPSAAQAATYARTINNAPDVVIDGWSFRGEELYHYDEVAKWQLAEQVPLRVIHAYMAPPQHSTGPKSYEREEVCFTGVFAGASVADAEARVLMLRQGDDLSLSHCVWRYPVRGRLADQRPLMIAFLQAVLNAHMLVPVLQCAVANDLPYAAEAQSVLAALDVATMMDWIVSDPYQPLWTDAMVMRIG